MPLTLTTPVSSGDLDPNASSYGKIKVIDFQARTVGPRKSLRFYVQLGNEDGEGNWIPGISRPKEFSLDSDAFAALAASHTANSGELTYDAVARGLYEWLISEGHYAGTID